MPLYPCRCPRCGPFDEWRPMAESARAGMCPSCGATGERALALPNVNRKGRRAPRAREPTLQKRSAEPGRSPPTAMTAAHTARPWMVGH